MQTALNPPDAYKTSVLSGLSPTMILDIASRAMVSPGDARRPASKLTPHRRQNFYTYQVGIVRADTVEYFADLHSLTQVQQENAFQSLVTKNAQEVSQLVGARSDRPG